jgi:amino acid permease
MFKHGLRLFNAFTECILKLLRAMFPSVFNISATGLLSRLPVFMFAFCCVQNMLPVVEEAPVANRSQKALDIISILSTASGLLVYAPIMMVPYAAFGKSVKDNVLESLPLDNIVVQVSWIGMSHDFS